MHKFSIATLYTVLLLSTSTATGDTYPKNTNVNILHYSFDLTLSDETNRIWGEASIEARFATAGVTEIGLDLIGVTQGGNTGMTVTGVQLPRAEEALNYRHASDRLMIQLPRPSKDSERIVLKVNYHGVPATGLIIGDNKFGERTFFSDNWPDRARHWLPTVDHPYDKATSEMIVTAPSHYQVISNGLLYEEVDLPGGQHRTHWRQSVPIATWLYALGVARFAVQHVGRHHGINVHTWVYPQDRGPGFHDFAVPTLDVLHFYHDAVGPYPYEKLANVQSNSVAGGMEAASAIFYSDRFVTGTRSHSTRHVIIHEIAHQWFGNSVTEYDWDDVWLSEGFATYFTDLFIEHAYGRDEFVAGLKSSRERIFSFYEENPNYRIIHDNLHDMTQVTSSQTYLKGGWTLHMLRGLLGDELFWDGIRAYYRLYRDRNASTEDFRRVMEETSGQELDWFFEQWLYSGGALVLEGEWTYDAVAGTVELQLYQAQRDGYLLRAPMEVELRFGSLGNVTTARREIVVEAEHERFSLPVGTEPFEVILDPDIWVLMRWQLQRR